jgi:ParB family chromosome partitioning protein
LYDVNELAGSLKDDEWARFERVVTETIDLRDRLREARTAAASA